MKKLSLFGIVAGIATIAIAATAVIGMSITKKESNDGATRTFEDEPVVLSSRRDNKADELVTIDDEAVPLKAIEILSIDDEAVALSRQILSISEEEVAL